MSNAPAVQPVEYVVPAPDIQGSWCWGSERRSANVPFLRITLRGPTLIVETKDYMHPSFVADTKDVLMSAGRLKFSYWYQPMARWAQCDLVLDASRERMTGTCEGEPSALQWSLVPSFLWRC